MNILGLNAFHGDSAACLFVDGQMVAAVEEERFRRIKHWAGFPTMAIEYCLASQKLTLSDIDVVAINSDSNAAYYRKLAYLFSGQASWALIKEKLLLRNKRQSVQHYLSDSFPNQAFKGRIQSVEHHLAHLASAYCVSPYNRSSIISVDGFGDFASTAWGLGSDGNVDLQNRIYFPHSMGVFYQALTQFLGFLHYGDEYKVMGLAPYGKPAYKQQLEQIVLRQENGEFRLNLEYFQHHRRPIGYDWDNDSPKVEQLYSDALLDLLGPARSHEQVIEQQHMDLARSIQDVYEGTFFHMLNHLHKQNDGENLTIAGGCGMNSVANGKVHLNTPYKNIYVQSAAGDAGGAIGAALIAGQRSGLGSDFKMQHSYWGPSFSDAELKKLLEANSDKLAAQNCAVRYDQSQDILVDTVSDYIIDASVVGWFQGAMEWGPRALGNRSILADPRRTDMKDVLNNKIKRRESFRPFAPSVLKEHVQEWFESDADVPFMMKVFQIQQQQRKKIPAVCHVDGSGRLQTVTEESNVRYYSLINSFYKKTQVPMLLNTSFNENEPVVCKPEEALACFFRTDMDVLVLGSHIVARV